MKKKDIAEFFEKLEVKYGPNLCSLSLKKTLEDNFNSIPVHRVVYMLSLYEDVYKGSVIFRDNKEGRIAAQRYGKSITDFLKHVHYFEGVLNSFNIITKEVSGLSKVYK